ncbi:lipopolysaccharide biosynthesis protein [Pseudogulbenkiania subflava]|uniref:Membrane protein involved in the export of O-antigen and teichoic acid n=1 Tax=Pseudogulbenkiania subflava DSM 22618 TaxID=1123014 RepID=A0A1Y6CC18_9NEIS|nr:oligosaccharide flippase family protein [Pseudogulbenkiania subflava]SMF54247.1 Membrane protein involved in the export of O-antigen and teichoic acid [Pseudogulbenkiania subflava DSM 22618]
MLKSAVQRLAAGGFARNVATLTGGAALAQLLPLLFAPLLTRLYSPDDFGLLAVFSAWLSNLAVIATARYDMAIVLPKDERDAERLMTLALAINLALLLVLTVLLLPAHGGIARLLGAPALAPWLLVLPAGVWLAGSLQAWTNWNNRQRRYAANAQGRVAQSLGVTLAQLGAGWAGLGFAGLIAGSLAGQALALWAQARADLATRLAWLRGHRRAELAEVARDYSEFPKVNTPHAFVVAFQDSLMLALLASLAGHAVVGQYALVLRVLKLPAALLGQAVSQVIFRDLAEAHAHGRAMTPLLARALAVLAGAALLPFGLLLVAAEPLFGWVFGAGWREAGVIAATLVPYLAAAFIAGPCFMVPMVIGRQRASFLFVLTGVVVNMAAFAAVFVSSRDALLAFKVMSGVMTLYFAAYVAWIFQLLRRLETQSA